MYTHELYIVIFSKNRPMQLDSLLRSIKDKVTLNILTVYVLWKATCAEFLEGYRYLRRKNILPGTVWVEERDFREDLNSILMPIPDSASIMFLVDDAVFFKPFDFDFFPHFSREHLFVSLRVSRSYTQDKQPRFLRQEPFLEWEWNYKRKKLYTWNYPFSVDGNIYHGHVVKKITSSAAFRSPNSLEIAMMESRREPWVREIGRGMAPPSATVYTIPLNRVQTEGETWHCDISAEWLNGQYLNGFRIDNNAIYRSTPDATHYAQPLAVEREAL